MTAQLSDTLLYGDEEYSICGVNGEGLFDPAHENIEAVAWETDCWKGFLCTYKILPNELLLFDLNVGLGLETETIIRHGQAPKIHGVYPSCSGESSVAEYRHLNLKIPFTGGLLLGKNFLWELYVHMGFHPAYKYQNVLEILFEEGNVIKVRDCSEKMAEIRRRGAEKTRHSDGDTMHELVSWIERCFDMSYETIDGF